MSNNFPSRNYNRERARAAANNAEDARNQFDQTLEGRFIKALEQGNVDEARKLIDQGANVNMQYGNTSRETKHLLGLPNKTPLMEPRDVDSDMMELLIEKGADINAEIGMSHTTALMYHAYTGHTECVRILLENGARIDPINMSMDMNAYDLAKYNRKDETANLIKSYDPAARSSRSVSPGAYNQTNLNTPSKYHIPNKSSKFSFKNTFKRFLPWSSKPVSSTQRRRSTRRRSTRRRSTRRRSTRRRY